MNRSDRKRRILLVEERGALRNLVRKVLEDAGYRVTVGGDLEETLRKVSDEALPVDLVVLDSGRAPDADGELVDEIRRFNPECRVVVVSERDETELAGADRDWIRSVSRPLKLSELFEAVESLLNRGSEDTRPTPDVRTERRGLP